MLEKRELQYVASATVRKDGKATTTPAFYRAPTQTTTSKGGSGSAGLAQSAPGQSHPEPTSFARVPHTWLKTIQSNLKQRHQEENPSAITPGSTLEQMTDEQLEDILAMRKLDRSC